MLILFSIVAYNNPITNEISCRSNCGGQISASHTVHWNKIWIKIDKT